MTEQIELSQASCELQEQLKLRFQETGAKLGRLVLRQSLEEGRQSHWIEPGMIIALESNTDDIKLEQLVNNPDSLAEYIIDGVSRVAGVEYDRILGPEKKKDAVLPRHVAMYLLRKHTSLSTPTIGRILGRDHTTVINGAEKIQTALAMQGKLFDKQVSVMVRQSELEIAEVIKILKDETASQETENYLAAIAINADGLNSYPAAKAKPLYAKTLGFRDPDTLVLDKSRMFTSDWHLEKYGQIALSVLNT